MKSQRAADDELELAGVWLGGARQRPRDLDERRHRAPGLSQLPCRQRPGVHADLSRVLLARQAAWGLPGRGPASVSPPP